jgi:long-chain acyl-CoA synthetase
LADWSQDLIPVEDARTLDGLFYQRVKRSPDRVAYRWFARADDAWHSISWRETARQVARWRDALRSEGLGRGDRVGILLRNCPEWGIVDQAALSLGMVTVPLYTDDRADNAAFILQDAAVKLLVIQDAHRWNRLAEVIDEQPWPRRAVLMEQADAALRAAAADPRAVLAADWLPESGADPKPDRESGPKMGTRLGTRLGAANS